MSNKMPPIHLMRAPISQLTVQDNFYMFGWQAQDRYTSCHSLRDYEQVTSNVRRYLRRIAIEGSIKTNNN